MAARGFVPVDARLAGLHWQRFETYEFARNTLGCFLAVSEVGHVAATAPFVFLRTTRGYRPYALFALSCELNAYVGRDGRWRSNYVPARLRSHPFILSGEGKGGVLMILEEALQRRKTPQSLPLLTASGDLSEPVRKISQYLTQLQREDEWADRLMRKVDRSRIFKRFEYPNASRRDHSWLFTVDWKALKEAKFISASALRDVALQRVLHAQAVSLTQIRQITIIEQQSQSTTGGAQGLEDFLDAVGGALQS